MPKCHLHTICLILLFLPVLMLSGCKKEQNNIVLPNKAEKKEISYTEFSNNEEYYVLQIPNEWVKTVEGSTIRFTEPKTGTFLSLNSEPYYPDINNYSQSYLSNFYADNGINLLNFIKSSGDSFEVALRYDKNSTEMVEYKTVYWNYDTIYFISFTAAEEKADKYIEAYNTACESFKCTSSSPSITDEFSCYYNGAAGITIEYPISWEYNEFESGFSVSNIGTGTTITVDIIEGIDNFDDITQLQYLDIMQNTVANISISSFNNSNGVIIAESFFDQNNTQYAIRNVMINKTSYIINLTFVASIEFTDTDCPYFEAMVKTINTI